jgi:hypothetical protein
LFDELNDKLTQVGVVKYNMDMLDMKLFAISETTVPYQRGVTTGRELGYKVERAVPNQNLFLELDQKIKTFEERSAQPTGKQLRLDDIKGFNYRVTESEDPSTPEYIEAVNDVGRLIENQLRFKTRKFRGKVKRGIIKREDYLEEEFGSFLRALYFPEYGSLQELKEGLENGDVINNLEKLYDEYQTELRERKDKFDALYIDLSNARSFIKNDNIEAYPEDQQRRFKRIFPALFGDLGSYKSRKQALANYRRLMTPLNPKDSRKTKTEKQNFLDKSFGKTYTEAGYFGTRNKLNKIEKLLNYNTLDPKDFQERIYAVIKNEMARRAEFFETPQMQEEVLYQKMRKAQAEYRSSARFWLQRMVKESPKSTYGKMAKLILDHPNTLNNLRSSDVSTTSFMGNMGGSWSLDGDLIATGMSRERVERVLVHELIHHFSVPYLLRYINDGYALDTTAKDFLEGGLEEVDKKGKDKLDFTDPDIYMLKELSKKEIDSIKKIETLFYDARRYYDEGVIAKDPKETDGRWYGLTNIAEFLAEALSNEDFAKELAKAPGRYGKKSNLLKDIFRAIFEFLFPNATSKEVGSLLEDVLALSEETFFGKDQRYDFVKEFDEAQAPKEEASKFLYNEPSVLEIGDVEISNLSIDDINNFNVQEATEVMTEMLSKKLGIGFENITEKQAVEILNNRSIGYNGEPGFYFAGKVYLAIL